MQGIFLNILVYSLLPTWTIYKYLTISKKTLVFFLIIEFATKISIFFCNSVKFCTHKKAIWEEHFMWLFSIHKLVSNINEQGWNDTKLGYEATKLTCLLIFIIFKVHNTSPPRGLKSNPLLMSFLVIHVVVVATCTNIVKLFKSKCSIDIILIDHFQVYL